MSKALITLLLSSTVLVGGAMAAQTTTATPSVPAAPQHHGAPHHGGGHHGDHHKMHGDVSAHAIKAMLEGKTPVVILDARDKKHFDEKRIKGAKSAPFDGTEPLATVAPDKDTVIITYCQNPKCPASDKLAEKLKKEGYKHVLEYKGGIDKWIEHGFETESAMPATSTLTPSANVDAPKLEEHKGDAAKANAPVSAEAKIPSSPTVSLPTPPGEHQAAPAPVTPGTETK